MCPCLTQRLLFTRDKCTEFSTKLNTAMFYLIAVASTAAYFPPSLKAAIAQRIKPLLKFAHTSNLANRAFTASKSIPVCQVIRCIYVVSQDWARVGISSARQSWDRSSSFSTIARLRQYLVVKLRLSRASSPEDGTQSGSRCGFVTARDDMLYV